MKKKGIITFPSHERVKQFLIKTELMIGNPPINPLSLFGEYTQDQIDWGIHYEGTFVESLDEKPSNIKPLISFGREKDQTDTK